MNVYLNLWGGEGYLSAASVLALASVGIYDGIVDAANSPVTINYGCFDFTPPENADKERCDDMYEAYKKYYCGIIKQTAPNINKTGLVIRDLVTETKPKNLEKKYAAKKAFLAFGCSEADMGTDLSQGIYGKPWVGEAYYVDSNFSPIYNGDTGNKVVINCGGYKGGGTAATFIPLENDFTPTGAAPERFDIIVGPSTQFNRFVQLRHKGIYSTSTYDNGVDRFDIPNVIEILNTMAGGIVAIGLHNENIAALEEEYKRIYDPENQGGPIDRRSLNPVNYMPRFVDRIKSDETMNSMNACFVNLKPNLESDADGFFNYDITSDSYQPDTQIHSMHITNLLSAVEVKEIAQNHGSYPKKGEPKGKVFTFQDNGNAFTLDGVFTQNDANKIMHFILFSLLITEYAFNSFNDYTLPGFSVLIDRWAIKEGGNILHPGRVVVPPKPSGNLNEAFASAAKEYFINLAHKYIKPTLQAFLDYNDTCPDVMFFDKTKINENLPDGVYGVVRDIVNKIQKPQNGPCFIVPENDSMVIQERNEYRIAAVVKGRFGLPVDFNAALGSIHGLPGGGLLLSYQGCFPSFGTAKPFGNRAWSKDVTAANVAQKAVDFCNDVTKYTYQKVCETFV